MYGVYSNIFVSFFCFIFFLACRCSCKYRLNSLVFINSERHMVWISNCLFSLGIDLSECLQYPDFSVVVLYKKVIIAFGFMVPDVKYNEAYISFLFVHPEWRRAGIATFMIYHLIQVFCLCSSPAHFILGFSEKLVGGEAEEGPPRTSQWNVRPSERRPSTIIHEFIITHRPKRLPL